MRKSLVKNSLFNILYKIVSVLYPLVAVTYVSHILMAERMGMVNYAQNIVSYFVIASALGIPTYGLREIAIRSYDERSRSNVFWELFVINTISTSISLFVYLFLILSVEKFRSQSILYLVAGLQIFFNYINVDWFYQGMEEYKYISIRSIIVKIIALIVLPIMVRTQDDYIWYALVYCLAIAGNNVFNIFRIRKFIVKPSGKLSLKRHLKPIAILLMVSIAVEIYAMIDTTMLGIYCDDSIVGCYSNSMKLTRTVTTTAAAIGAVLFPRLSMIFREKNYSRFNELVNTGLKIMLVFAIPASVGMILLCDDIILVLFGNTFMDASPLLKILSLMIPIVVCNTLMGGQVLVTTGQEKKYMISVTVASIVNIILNGTLIPRYGAPSAAIASLVSETIVLTMYIFFAREQVKISFSFRYIYSIVLPLGLYVAVHCFLLDPLGLSTITNIVVNIIACVSMYSAGGLLLKNESMIFIVHKIIPFK